MPTLALDGGTPIRSKPMHPWPIFDQREEQLLHEVLHSGNWGMLSGDKVRTFEERFAEFQGAKHALCVPNGTLALELALLALEIEPGDEVVVPAYTFIATASAVLRVGAKPVFADIDPLSYTMDPVAVIPRLSDKTKALLPVHLAGRPADMDGMCQIARERGLRLVEDACQAWGAEWRPQPLLPLTITPSGPQLRKDLGEGKRVGTFGDLGAFSFQSSKNLNAGEGGALVTNDDALYERCWSLHNVGRIRAGAWYQHEILGLNLRMTEWQGAILLAQLERMQEQAQRRQSNIRYLCQRLTEIPGIEPLPDDPRVSNHAYHLLILRYDPACFGGQPVEKFAAALSAEGINPVSQGYVPLHQSPAIRKTMQERFGIDPAETHLEHTEAAVGHTLWLLQHIFLGTQEDMDDIAAAMLKIQGAWQETGA
jgi:dTDP-4-amino-4,6-dideoxygalactose transaminase